MTDESSPFHIPPPDGEYYVFRDPVYNLIEVHNELEGRFLRRLLATYELQRLRRIGQNGLGNLVYPGLEGTRFAHSLGSYHIARKIIRSLRERQPQSTEGFPSFLKITERDCVAFPVAALVHDIGHGPLSHAWEEIFDYNHEETGLEAIKSDETQIGYFLKNNKGFSELDGIGSEVVDLLEGRHRLSFLTPLLSGNLDIDRLDFMVRDTRNAGVNYGFHDLDWILRALRFMRLPENKSNPRPQWVIGIDGRKGLGALVQFLRAREYMYDMVYLHKTTRAAIAQLKSIFRRAHNLSIYGHLDIKSDGLHKCLNGDKINIVEKLQLDDSDVWWHIKHWSQSDDSILATLCGEFLRRRLFKVFRVEREVFDKCKLIDSCEYGQHFRETIAARMECGYEEAQAFYCFDNPSFNLVGRMPRNPMETVWIMRQNKYGHYFESLHDYWRSAYSQASDLDKNYCFVIVHHKCVSDVNKLIDRLSIRTNMQVMPTTPPTSYRLLGSLGKEGAHKTAFVGALTRPGAAQEGIVALKQYKNPGPTALRRDVSAINLLIRQSSKYLSFASSVSSGDSGFWVMERLWSASLLDLINEDGPRRDVYEVATIGLHLFRGLSVLHEANLRHTDIKPDNCGFVLNDSRNRTYVLGDFGCVDLPPANSSSLS
jgi:hypothetical protein